MRSVSFFFSILQLGLIYAGLVVLAVLLWDRPGVLAGAFLVIGAFMLGLWRERTTWIMFLVAAVAGPAAEFFAVRSGAWSYSAARWSLPLWLPLAWGMTGAIFLRLTQVISAATGDRRANKIAPTGW